MYLLNKEKINNLPIHDSDLLNLNISQSDDGRTELRLTIAFYKDEIDISDKPLIALLGENNEADILFNNCHWVNLDAYYNITSRDEFDYVEYLQDTPQLDRYGTEKTNNHINIKFISGSTIECIFEEVSLVPSKKSL